MNVNEDKATIYEYARLCKSKKSCDKCPLGYENTGEFVSCIDYLKAYPKEANKIILHWAKNYPKQKENYQPFTPCPQICPLRFAKEDKCQDILKRLFLPLDTSCTECREEYWSTDIIIEIK